LRVTLQTTRESENKYSDDGMILMEEAVLGLQGEWETVLRFCAFSCFSSMA
jgi:hypothetical protein